MAALWESFSKNVDEKGRNLGLWPRFRGTGGKAAGLTAAPDLPFPVFAR